MSQSKYRPVLTASQISHLITLCKKDPSLESLSCLSVLGAFEYKIRNQSIEPAYSVTLHKRDMSAELGFTDVTVTSESSSAISNLEVKAHDDESLYQKWLENPDALDISQLKRVQLYRYQSGKMMPEEEGKYEKETLGV